MHRVNKNYDRMINDVRTHQFPIYDAMGYTYCKAAFGIYGKDTIKTVE